MESNRHHESELYETDNQARNGAKETSCMFPPQVEVVHRHYQSDSASVFLLDVFFC